MVPAMSDNVVTIGGEKMPEPVGKPSVVDTLRNALAMAERGEIEHVVVAYAGAEPKHMTSNKWAGTTSLLMYAMQRALHEMNLEIDAGTPAAPDQG
jgi:hypothetical protein